MSKVDEEIYEWQHSIEWESPPCNYCGCESTEFYLETQDARFHGRRLRLVRCPNCGLVYASPRPSTDSYRRVYHTLWAEETRRFKYMRPAVETWHREVIFRARRLKPDARTLFDVGTGAGTVLIAGRRLKLRVAGNDLNRAAVEWLWERGYTVYNQPTNTLKLEERFDIITCLDYIEHTNTPYDDLRWVSDHLKPKGVLYLKTLHMDSEAYKVQGERWHMLAGFHTHYFYKDVLLRMISDTGLKVRWVKMEPEIIHLTAVKS